MKSRKDPTLCHLRIADYLTLQRLACSVPHHKLTAALNAGGFANWTVCPVCKVDDFIHAAGCPLLPRAKGGEWLKVILGS